MNKSINTTMLCVLSVFLFALFFTSGCANKQEAEQASQPNVEQNAVPNNESQNTEMVELDVEDPEGAKMVSYDLTEVGRSDPFVPYGEYKAFEDARISAINEANAHNALVAEYTRNANVKIRELDDISPYKFNLPVPPTSLASADTAAAKIVRTKVVGIMYNPQSPSAIINFEDKDYLVRPGDKIIDEQYKVIKINPNWITVSLGSNIYSAAIGELFTKDSLDASRNDLYNMKNRFGGRKS